jgi:hypothetical protein
VHRGWGIGARRGLAGARPTWRSGSPELAGGGQGQRWRRGTAEGVLTSAQAAAERRRDDGGE